MLKKISTLLIVITLGACGTVQKAQYSALESVGIHKRDVLVNRIENTADAQQQTKEQIKSTYERFAELVEINDDKGLEKKYTLLAKAVDRSEKKAAELNDHINSVDEVATALFNEWQKELNEYSSASLRNKSQQNLVLTKKNYAQLLKKMRQSQNNIEPVLHVLQDNTLYLKHNLNAHAVNSLKNEVLTIENKVSLLIRQMELSINESQTFINDMRGS